MRAHRKTLLVLTPLLITGWMATAAPATAKSAPKPDASTPPAEVLQKILLQKIRDQAQRPPTSYDQPDEAARFYAMKRFPAGEQVDPVKLYAAARRHMQRMPRYASRHRRFLPSLAEVARNPVLKAAGAQLDGWEPLGPGNIGGRTRVLLIDPERPRIRYAAGVSGGIWKSEDNGRNWRPVADLIPNIAVNSMAMDPTDSDVLYAGTGEGYFREVIRGTDLPLRGAGIFKSADGGESWEQLAGTWNRDFRWVNDIAISPHDHRRLYAATRTGVWRSRNGGKSWVRTLDPEARRGCLDLAIRTDRETDWLFASCGTLEQATVYRADDAAVGKSWTPVLNELGMARTSLAIAPSNQEIIYALAASYVPGPAGRFNGGLHAVFRSDDGGGTWQAVVRNTDPVKLNTLILSNPLAAHLADCGLGPTNYPGTLGWYTNVIAVDPTDPDVVWAGGVDLFRSDDGGRNWGLVTCWWESPP
ncbi:MAG: hypothetical protein GY856_38605, partial [bacterium]|nr:hypothetical protein [bacterium]